MPTRLGRSNKGFLRVVLKAMRVVVKVARAVLKALLQIQPIDDTSGVRRKFSWGGVIH